MGNKTPVGKERLAEIARLEALPEGMRVLPQWLLWKFEHREGEKKPRKVPFYANGVRRTGAQGSASDRQKLVTFEAAMQRLRDRADVFAGLGFAFLPGDALIGIDIDHAIDPATGEIDQRWQRAIADCDSYTEWSVSGTGVHIIVRGETKPTKNDGLGLELYQGSQFFVCSGRLWPGAPASVRPIREDVLAGLQAMVAQANEKEKAERAAAKAAARAAARASAPPPAPRPAQTRAQPPQQPVNDFPRVNAAALQQLGAWVPELLPDAIYQPGTGAYRVTSAQLGRDLEEDLSVHPDGITDWGTGKTMTAIDLVIELRGCTARDALWWLAERVGITLSRPLRVVGGTHARAPAPDDAEADREAVAGVRARPTRRPRREVPDELIARLRDHFALIYGSDTVYDCRTRLMMPLSAMAHAYGTDAVRIWKSLPPSPRRSDGGRWTVLPENVVFDPEGKRDPDTHVNLFAGLRMQPKKGDVQPMLDLVTYLTSTASDNEDECEEIRHQLLCWLAYPLQHIGAKLRSAVVMHGDEGAGKNFLTDTMTAIYGEYGATVGQDELEDKFNEWRSRKLFVCGDEVSTRADLTHNKNRLKGLVTSPTVQINPKNMPRREEENHMNVMLLGNELQPAALDTTDRRYLVIQTPAAREFSYYKNLARWRAEGGTAAWFDFLLSYPLDGFEPFGPAMKTRAKQELIEINLKSAERFWIEWSGSELGLPYRTCAVDQAYSAYKTYAVRIGDRFPVQKYLFTRLVQNISRQHQRPCTVKVMKVDHGVGGFRDVRSVRMLLVMPIPPDEPLGEFASDAYRQFIAPLNAYRGMHDRDHDDDDQPGKKNGERT